MNVGNDSFANVQVEEEGTTEASNCTIFIDEDVVASTWSSHQQQNQGSQLKDQKQEQEKQETQQDVVWIGEKNNNECSGRFADIAPCSMNDAALQWQMRQIGLLRRRQYFDGDDDERHGEERSQFSMTHTTLGDGDIEEPKDARYVVQQKRTRNRKLLQLSLWWNRNTWPTGDDAPNNYRNNSDNNNDDDEKSDDNDDFPEAVSIRHGTNALRMLRFVIVGIVLLALVALTFLVVFTQSDDYNDFTERQPFGGVMQWNQQAEQWLRVVLKSELQTKFTISQRTAQSLSLYYSSSSATAEEATPEQQVAPTPNTSNIRNKIAILSSLDETLVVKDLLQTQRVVSKAVQVAWSPWIETWDERLELEMAGTAASVAPSFYNSSNNSVLETSNRTSIIRSTIFRFNDTGRPITETANPPYHPIWLECSIWEDYEQGDAMNSKLFFLFNQMSLPERAGALRQMTQSGLSVWSPTFTRDGPFYLLQQEQQQPRPNDDDGSTEEDKANLSYLQGEPSFVLFTPVWMKLPLSSNETSDHQGESAPLLVGSIASEFVWSTSFGSGGGTATTVSQDAENVNGSPSSSPWMPMDVVVENTCGQMLTYRIENDGAWIWQGQGDLHSVEYSHWKRDTTYQEFQQLSLVTSPGMEEDAAEAASRWQQDKKTLFTSGQDCRYRFHVYPTNAVLEEDYDLESDVFFWCTVTSVACFALVLVLFILFDWFVRRRQQLMINSSLKSRALVSSLFPRAIRGRLLEEHSGVMFSSMASSVDPQSPNHHLRHYHWPRPRTSGRRNSMRKTDLGESLHDGEQQVTAQAGSSELPLDSTVPPPIAELFPCTTVMFLDIAGFTAWSSEREPTQVFQLLETLYQSFDEVASRLGVFKIETIGDSYIAVTGLPEPRDDHAVVMARFAEECLRRMKKLTKMLEAQLGPSTGDLQGRVGLHSGSVTGGVLRGQKARFQLFGDTVNTAARMESAGSPGKIHVSSVTANLLIDAGKKHWVTERDHMITAKGKGKMQTYWVNTRPKLKSPTTLSELSDPHATTSTADMSDMASSPSLLDHASSPKDLENDKTMRLVEWNVELLCEWLQNLQAHRTAAAGSGWSTSVRPRLRRQDSKSSSVSSINTLTDEENSLVRLSTSIVDEITEAIEMPRFDARLTRLQQQHEMLQQQYGMNGNSIGDEVRSQLREYVTRIASMYRDVPFHNFEHASHVALSASKLVRRVVKAKSSMEHHTDAKSSKAFVNEARDMYYATYGISSDPLMQFAMVFAALIHDVDHPGFPNEALTRMKTPASIIYKGKSVSEQNSFEVAWRVLMDEDFEKLRSCIYTNKAELTRFRQLLVNAVIATDLMDEQLQRVRSQRWESAFAETKATTRRHSDPNNSITKKSSNNHRRREQEGKSDNNRLQQELGHLSNHRRQQQLGKSSNHRQQLNTSNHREQLNSSNHREQLNTSNHREQLDSSNHRRQQWGSSNSNHRLTLDFSNHRRQQQVGSSSNHREPQDLDSRSFHGNHVDHLTLERRATQIFECIMQASDVAHMMQHWQTYTKYNERLFLERYLAFVEGHSTIDPSGVWYQSELDFFDNFVLPLTDRLHTCGVFTQYNGSEFKNWAQQNRDNWEKLGPSIVRRMLEQALTSSKISSLSQRQRPSHPPAHPALPSSVLKSLKRHQSQEETSCL